MGNCCSNNNVEKSEIKLVSDIPEMKALTSEREIVLVIRVQAVIRGYLQRKRYKNNLDMIN